MSEPSQPSPEPPTTPVGPSGTLLVTPGPATKTVVIAEPLTERPGDKIGPYKLLQQIGEGGCGVVYMAEQEEPVRRRVALKVIKLGMDTRSVIARFEAERQALALMDHPNIARVLDAGTTEAGRPFFVMELVRGIRITEYCDQNKLATNDRLTLFVQVCRAIQHAHQKGIIHRDIKPSNILVTLHDGVPVPKVIDFGIAKATQGKLTDLTLFTAFEQFIGTPAYMSPEQAEMSGLDIDTRSDIYALGVLLYELLTGQTPFDTKKLLAAGLDELRHAIREQEPERPSTRLRFMLESDLTTTALHRRTEPPKLIHLVRGDLDWIVMKALEKDRTRRYETANGLAMDIQRHLQNEPVVARPPSTLYQFQKLMRRNSGIVAAAGAVFLALLLGLGLSLYLFVQERDARRRAVAAEREQARLRQKAEEALVLEGKLRAESRVNEQLAAAGRLLSQAQYDQAEQTVYQVTNAASAPILNSLGLARARRGEWQRAITNYSKMLEVVPSEQMPYCYLAALMAEAGDEPGYRQNCEKILARFGGTHVPAAAERMAKACLILPPQPDQMAAVARLANLAGPNTPNRNVLDMLRVVKGLAEYRQGRFFRALTWLQGRSERENSREVSAFMIEAMARYRLDQNDAARAALAKGVQIANSEMPRFNGRDLGAQWPDWLVAQVLTREASALLGPAASGATNSPPNP